MTTTAAPTQPATHPRRPQGRLNYSATRAHRQARLRADIAAHSTWEPYVAWYADDRGIRREWPGSFYALDVLDAQDCIEYHLSRYRYEEAREFCAAWLAGGRLVRRESVAEARIIADCQRGMALVTRGTR